MADKILIVDDDSDLRTELRDCLEGYEVVEASSGEVALKMLKKANEIGIAILDVMMPGIDGLDVLKEIKKTDPRIHIIILTGHSSKAIAIEALKGRADDYIEKPLDIPKIKEIVDRVFEVKLDNGNTNFAGIRGKIEKIKNFTERNCYKKLKLEDAAKAVCLSPKYLSRIFKQMTGKTFSEFRLEIKIKKSKELLNKSGYNINQIAEKLGYENSESFIRQFKKLTGNTPTGYRKRKGRSKNGYERRHR